MFTKVALVLPRGQAEGRQYTKDVNGESGQLPQHSTYVDNRLVNPKNRNLGPKLSNITEDYFQQFATALMTQLA